MGFFREAFRVVLFMSLRPAACPSFIPGCLHTDVVISILTIYYVYLLYI